MLPLRGFFVSSSRVFVVKTAFAVSGLALRIIPAAIGSIL